MKKLLALLFIASTMLISCEQNCVNEPDNPKDAPSFTFMEGTEVSPTIGYVGGELAFNFISNCSWTVEENDDWINISPTSGNQGNHTLAISVAKNITGEERLSKITILYGVDSQVVINLTQEANEVFETDSEGNYIVEADGGTVAVKVTTNLEYDVIIPDEASAWLSLADTRVIRKETLTFNVAKNEDSEERSATVNLCAKGGDILQTITIKQNKSNFSCANNEVIYTTKYGYPIELNITEGFGGDLMSHTYENGYGRISFDNDVVSIPNEAFKNCTTLTTIVLPNSLSTINSSAFENCTSLTSITIPDSVTKIGESAFSDCNSLTSITIPDSVTLIGSRAFYGCTSLTSVTIGNGVTEIGSYTFYNCTSLTSLTIPDSVTEIGSYAFMDCTSLTSITIPDSVTTIGSRAFYGCTSLTSVTIGNGVTKIGGYTFYNCTGELIVNCNIPSATTLESGAFYGADFTKVSIGDSVTEIGSYAFYDCTSLTRFNGKFASEDNRCLIFNGELVAFARAGLTEYAIPYSVTTIGGYAFTGCTSLTSITIPDSVTEIGYSVFEYCDSLTSITIPDSVTTIGSRAFYGCTSLTSVTIGNGVTSIGSSAFSGCTGELIVNCNIPSATYPDGGAFYEADFTKVTISNSVTTIGSYAFRDCTSLTSLTIPDSVTEIGACVFHRCTSLTSVTIPDSITEIGDSAFRDCTSLTSLTIGNGVISIGSWAFDDCTSLMEVYCKPITPPMGGYLMFDNNASGRKIYVPTESVEAYKSASYWWDYSGKIFGYNF